MSIISGVSGFARLQLQRAKIEIGRSESMIGSFGITENGNNALHRPYSLQYSCSPILLVAGSEKISEDDAPYLCSGDWATDVSKWKGKDQIQQEEFQEVRSVENWNQFLDDISVKTSRSTSDRKWTHFFSDKIDSSKTSLKTANQSLPRSVTPAAIDKVVLGYIFRVIRDYKDLSSENAKIHLQEIVSKQLKESDLLVYPIIERAKLVKHSFKECDTCVKKKHSRRECMAAISTLRTSGQFVEKWNNVETKMKKYFLRLIHRDKRIARCVIKHIQKWLGKEGEAKIAECISANLDQFKLNDSAQHDWNVVELREEPFRIKRHSILKTIYGAFSTRFHKEKKTRI